MHRTQSIHSVNNESLQIPDDLNDADDNYECDATSDAPDNDV
jgi:hypothetical protein